MPENSLMVEESYAHAGRKNLRAGARRNFIEFWRAADGMFCSSAIGHAVAVSEDLSCGLHTYHAIHERQSISNSMEMKVLSLHD